MGEVTNQIAIVFGVLVACFAGPAAALFVLIRRKAKARQSRRSPIGIALLRGAGHSLRGQFDETRNDLTWDLVLLMVLPLLALFLAQSHVPGVDVSAAQCASLLANLSALTLDFAARQKLGGTTLNYFYLKQFPVLHTRSYGGDHLKFIVPRVLDQPGRPSATAARRPPIRPRRPPGGMIVTIHGNPSHGT